MRKPPGVDHRSGCNLRDQGWNSCPAGLLRQLPSRQSQLCDCGCASDRRPHEPGDGSRTRHDHSLRPMARTRAGVGSCRCHLRQWRISAMVAGAGHHSLYAYAGQCLAEEKPILWPRTFYLSARKQTVIAIRQASNSITAAGMLGTAPMPISEPASVVVRAHRKRNAPMDSSGILPSTCRSRLGNGGPRPGRDARLRPCARNGNERKWRHCSRSSRIRSDCVACAYAG